MKKKLRKNYGRIMIGVAMLSLIVSATPVTAIAGEEVTELPIEYLEEEFEGAPDGELTESDLIYEDFYNLEYEKAETEGKDKEIRPDNNGAYSYTYKEAQAGKQYVLMVVEGKHETLDKVEITESKLIHIDQKTAADTEVSFSKFIPLKNTDATVIISSDALEAPVIVAYISEIKEPEKFTVKFETNGGNSIEDKVCIADDVLNLKDIVPVKEGFVFDGWFLDADFKESCGDSITITKDVTLYAKWSEEKKEEENKEDENKEDDKDKDKEDGDKDKDKEDDKNRGEVLPGDSPAGGGKIPTGLWVAVIKDQTYTGSAVKPEVHVYYSKKRLVEGRDFSVSYSNNIAAHEGGTSSSPTAVIKGKGNYCGSTTVYFTIQQLDVSKSTALASNSFKAGKSYKPVIVTVPSNNVLSSGKDYSITYDNGTAQPTSEGKHTITITGSGSCKGTKRFDYTISGTVKDIKKAKVKIGKVYYGAGEPKVSLTLNKVNLTQGTDYVAVFSNMDSKSKASVTFIGKGNYCGTLKKKLNMKAASVASASVTFEKNAVYEKGGVKPEPVVELNGVMLKKGTDYTVSYKNNKKTSNNKAKLIVKGKGNYSGSATVKFSVIAQEFTKDGANVFASDVASGKKPTIIAFDKNGKKLTVKTDYKATINKNEKKVTIGPGKNKLYKGSATLSYRELESGKLLSTVTLNTSAADFPGSFTYTGDKIVFKKEWLTVTTGDGTVLDANKSDYEIAALINNVKKGTAVVVVRGKGNYGGIKTLNINIDACDMQTSK